VHAGVDARLEREVALPGPRELPAPEGLRAAEEVASEDTRVLVGDAGEARVGLIPLRDLDLGFEV